MGTCRRSFQRVLLLAALLIDSAPKYWSLLGFHVKRQFLTWDGGSPANNLPSAAVLINNKI